MKHKFDLTKDIGSLSNVVDQEKGIVKKSTETERLRVKGVATFSMPTSL